MYYIQCGKFILTITKELENHLINKCEHKGISKEMVKDILRNSKEEQYSEIGLIDDDGILLENLKQPVRITGHLRIMGEDVISAEILHGEDEGRLLELNEEHFNAQYTVKLEKDNIYLGCINE